MSPKPIYITLRQAKQSPPDQSLWALQWQSNCQKSMTPATKVWLQKRECLWGVQVTRAFSIVHSCLSIVPACGDSWPSCSHCTILHRLCPCPCRHRRMSLPYFWEIRSMTPGCCWQQSETPKSLRSRMARSWSQAKQNNIKTNGQRMHQQLGWFHNT